jgi:hypothetical protein
MEAWRQWPLGWGDEVMTNTNHKNQLDSDRPSHGRRFHALSGKVGFWMQSDFATNTETPFNNDLAH